MSSRALYYSFTLGNEADIVKQFKAEHIEIIADPRLVMIGIQKIYGAKNPFSFMDLQDVQELANFFERRVSAYQVAVAGDVSFNEAF